MCIHVRMYDFSTFFCWRWDRWKPERAAKPDSGLSGMEPLSLTDGPCFSQNALGVDCMLLKSCYRDGYDTPKCQMSQMSHSPHGQWGGGGGNGGSSLTGLRVLLLVKKYVYFTVHFSPLCNNEVISFYVFREFWPSWAPVLCIENPNPCDHGNSFLKEVIGSNERVLFNSPSPLRLGRFNSLWAPEFLNRGKSVKVIELFSLVSFFFPAKITDEFEL